MGGPVSSADAETPAERPVREAQLGVEQLAARAFTVPTDAPEADGTLSWDATTIVVAEARGPGTRASAIATRP